MVHGFSIRSSNSSVGDFNFATKMNDIRGLKHNLTLDLYEVTSRGKKNKFTSGLNDAPVLSTPDYERLGLNSPEVEKMLSGTSIDLQTPTPSTMQSLFGKIDHENIFNEDGLAVLHNLNNESSHHNILNGLQKTSSNLNNNNSSSNLTMSEYDYENQYPTPISTSYGMDFSPPSVKIKDEPQTVPNIVVSPPVSPLNMDSQERMKADRKKARNRLAAAKCRKKKLEKIACLENRVKELKDENNELGQKQASLKKEVSNLKERIVRHYQKGCTIVSSTGPLFG